MLLRLIRAPRAILLLILNGLSQEQNLQHIAITENNESIETALFEEKKHRDLVMKKGVAR